MTEPTGKLYPTWQSQRANYNQYGRSYRPTKPRTAEPTVPSMSELASLLYPVWQSLQACYTQYGRACRPTMPSLLESASYYINVTLDACIFHPSLIGLLASVDVKQQKFSLVFSHTYFTTVSSNHTRCETSEACTPRFHSDKAIHVALLCCRARLEDPMTRAVFVFLPNVIPSARLVSPRIIYEHSENCRVLQIADICA